MQVPMFPERYIESTVASEDPLSWKGDLLAIGIYSDSLKKAGMQLAVLA